MVADTLFRVACHGGGDEPLGVHLKRITGSAYTRKTLGGADIEGELVAPVIAESHDEDCRREIMQHLHECLSATGSKHWQRIYGGLALSEFLMHHGSPALLDEVSQGFHFDLVQKVSLLENFDAKARACTDRRAESIVRMKAKELRNMLVSQLQQAAEDQHKDGLLESSESVSTCSGKISTATPSTAASSSRSSPISASWRPEPRSPTKDLFIDDAFTALREWMESPGSNSPSAPSSPASAPSDSDFTIEDSDWEPLAELPPTHINAAAMHTPVLPSFATTSASMSAGSEGGEEFFTPLPPHAFARSPPMHAAALLSL